MLHSKENRDPPWLGEIRLVKAESAKLDRLLGRSGGKQEAKKGL